MKASCPRVSSELTLRTAERASFPISTVDAHIKGLLGRSYHMHWRRSGDRDWGSTARSIRCRGGLDERALGCLLGSYRIATAEPSSVQLTKLKAICFDRPANSVGPLPTSLDAPRTRIHRSIPTPPAPAEAYTSDRQSPARRPLEPLDIRFQIPGTSSPKQIVSRSGKLAAE